MNANELKLTAEIIQNLIDEIHAASKWSYSRKFHRDNYNNAMAIAECCNMAAAPLGCDGIFEPVIHKVFWGKYPPHNAVLTKLLDTVLDEFDRQTPLANLWKMSGHFDDAFLKITNRSSHSEVEGLSCRYRSHHDYLVTRTMHRLNYCSPNLLRFPFDCKLYEAKIHRLLPESKHWDESQWYDDKNILLGLLCKYNFDYIQKRDELFVL